MRSSNLLQTAWLSLLIAGVVLSGVLRSDASAPRAQSRLAEAAAPELRFVTLPSGEKGLPDASGHLVPLRNYRRIAAGSTVADELLLQLAEPERIVALTSYGREHNRQAFRYGSRAGVGGPSDLERLEQLNVDLLILNHLGAPTELARAREAGIEVFNLGPMRGLDTLIPNARVVAALLGDEQRARVLNDALLRRMHAVAADVAPAARKRAVYATAYGGQLFGGAAGTSYHDVLTAAGLIDAAAEKYRDWPHYDPEQLLALDPEIIVTSRASVAGFCRINGLAQLRACQAGGQGVIGLDDALLGNPGLSMLDAAEQLRDLVYGPQP